MDRRIIDLWADIGSKRHWDDLLSRELGVFVPFDERWPQPGFIGESYFEETNRVLVMGQNPRASNTKRANESDIKMFSLIQNHSLQRSGESMDSLFSMMRMFMLGIKYKPAWKPITATERHLGLNLDRISYLNLIPLATYDDRISPAFREAYEHSTKRQLEALQPEKVVVFGKGAYEKFKELSGGQWDARHLQQRNFKDVPSVKGWLNS